MYYLGGVSYDSEQGRNKAGWLMLREHLIRGAFYYVLKDVSI